MAAVDMDADDEILRKLASGTAIDFSSWPVVLADIVARIEKTARNDFPIPRIPQPKPASPLPEPRLLDPLPSSDPIDPSAETSSATAVANDESQGSSSQETNKENTNPAPAAAAHTTTTTATTTSSEPADPTALPPQVISLMNDITTTLTTSFPLYPPHTAQRLAELVLAPRQHYRSLPSYLHALDRVVHVTSGSNVFPLPPAVPDMSTMTLLSNGPARDGPWVNGTSTPSPASSSSLGNPPPINVGSDEALGGALLTPIPWLQRRAGSSSASGGSSSPPEPDPTQLAQQQQQQGQATGHGQQGNGGSGGQFEGQVHTETTETIEGPNGMGSIETVSISVNGIPSHGATLQLQRGVTQGELLRQEQRAGVVPVTQLARASMPATAGPMVGGNNNGGSSAAGAGNNPSTSSSPSAAAAAQAAEGTEEDTAMPDEDADPSAPPTTGDDAPPTASTTAEPTTSEDDEAAASGSKDQLELPHARGPEEIGAADTGPQRESSSTFVTSPSGAVEMHGIDVAAAVGRNKADDIQPSKKSTSPEATEGGGERASTPKREAEGGPDDAAEPAAKRLKEDESGGDATAGEAEGVKKDSEGDVVLTDEDKEGGKEA